MTRRGATEQEVVDTIRTSSWSATELDRQDCRKEFAFGGEWNGRVYARKQVRPVFVEEPDAVVVVTVYVYYVR
jgi:hypothetical protein